MSDNTRRTRRFYVGDLSQQRVEIAGDEVHHAARVLRLKAGDDVELFDGRGARARGRVENIGRNRLGVLVEHVERAGERPRPLVHLAFSVPKGKRLDWLVEKATELGAASLRPIVFRRSVAGGQAATDAKRDRRLVHCIAAAKQCGLDWLPQLHDPGSLPSFLAEVPGSVKLVGCAGDDVPALGVSACTRSEGPDEICLLIGPEGGLDEDETNAVIQAGFQPVRLGRTVLRVETAAIALLAAVTALCGEWQKP